MAVSTYMAVTKLESLGAETLSVFGRDLVDAKTKDRQLVAAVELDFAGEREM
jgi:hypothetical protein